MAKAMGGKPATARRMTGKANLYRGKVRSAPKCILLTREGLGLLEDHTARTGLSASDFVESLLRGYGHKVSNAAVPVP